MMMMITIMIILLLLSHNNPCKIYWCLPAYFRYIVTFQRSHFPDSELTMLDPSNC